MIMKGIKADHVNTKSKCGNQNEFLRGDLRGFIDSFHGFDENGKGDETEKDSVCETAQNLNTTIATKTSLGLASELRIWLEVGKGKGRS